MEHANSEEDIEDSCLVQMDGSDVMASGNNYTDSLHYKVNKEIKNGNYLTRGQKLGLNTVKVKPQTQKIKFGSTSMTDYQIIAQLGRGTYGEVNKCLHQKTNTTVAIKTFLFEVSPTLQFTFTLERIKRDQLQHNEGDIAAQAARTSSLLRQAARCVGGERWEEELDPLRF
jgi:serine/threonine protein kinase